MEEIPIPAPKNVLALHIEGSPKLLGNEPLPCTLKAKPEAAAASLIWIRQTC
jgi:hypothetical protein